MAGLGTLVRFPPELRLMIYESVDDVPLKLSSFSNYGRAYLCARDGATISPRAVMSLAETSPNLRKEMGYYTKGHFDMSAIVNLSKAVFKGSSALRHFASRYPLAAGAMDHITMIGPQMEIVLNFYMWRVQIQFGYQFSTQLSTHFQWNFPSDAWSALRKIDFVACSDLPGNPPKWDLISPTEAYRGPVVDSLDCYGMADTENYKCFYEKDEVAVDKSREVKFRGFAVLQDP